MARAKEWSQEEYKATVLAYIKMRDDIEKQGKERVNKKGFYRALNKKFPDRSPGAFERRMQNISHVYRELGMQWIEGLVPARNVGRRGLQIIEELILQNEGSIPTPESEFEEQVSKLIKHGKVTSKPRGKVSPQKQATKTASYVRDPKVAAWILKNSDGVCESCRNSAPFVKPDGLPYLEIHHVKRLADGGSDRLKNTVAVCPNCHRQLHYGKDRDKILEKLYTQVDRLVRE